MLAIASSRMAVTHLFPVAAVFDGFIVTGSLMVDCLVIRYDRTEVVMVPSALASECTSFCVRSFVAGVNVNKKRATFQFKNGPPPFPIVTSCFVFSLATLSFRLLYSFHLSCPQRERDERLDQQYSR